MADKVTFIHAADVHLGAAFKGLRSLSPTWADRLVRAIPEAYQRIIEVALEEHVDFVVLAGDIFDGAQPSYADFSCFVAGLQRLEQVGIPVYLCTGNHDPYTAWHQDYFSLPTNVHIVGATKPSFEVFQRDGRPIALVGGRGYYNQSWPSDVDISEGISRGAAETACGVSAPFVVGVLHTGLDIDPTRSPVPPRSLLNRGVDYWACGHIHQPRVSLNENNPCVVFSGCPQGRDIREEGPHGVYKVTLEEHHANTIEFIPTAQVVWQRAYLDVGECETIAEMQERITNEEFSLNAQAHCQQMVFRFVLTGRTLLHDRLTEQVLEDVRTALNDRYPFFFVDALVNKTKPLLDTQALRSEGLFPAVYLQTLDRYREHPSEVMGLLDQQFCQRDVVLPASLERSLDELCDDAEIMVLDLLGQDEDL